jgi:hypothetical protein
MRRTWSTDDLLRLGRMVKQRRLDLGFSSQDELSRSGGPAEPTIGTSVIQLLERQNDPKLPQSERTVARYEARLRWVPGTFDRILADPEHVPETVPATAVPLGDGRLPYSAVVAASENLTTEEQERLLGVLLDRVHHARRSRPA